MNDSRFYETLIVLIACVATILLAGESDDLSILLYSKLIGATLVYICTLLYRRSKYEKEGGQK